MDENRNGRADPGLRLPVDGERLREFDAILEKYRAGKRSLERRVVSAEQWWKLRNEAEERRRGLGRNDDFHARSGWLHNVIVAKHADAMDAYPEPLVLPREPGDSETAETLSAVLPVILEQNRFEKTYSDAVWQKLKTGTAVYKVTWDQDLHNGLGDVSIVNTDLLGLFWEPGITDIQKSRYFFHCELQDDEVLEAEYPQLEGKLKGCTKTTLTRFLYDDAVSTDGKSLVVDVYYKVKAGGRTVLHYCKYVGDTVLESTENRDLEAALAAAASHPSCPRPPCDSRIAPRDFVPSRSPTAAEAPLPDEDAAPCAGTGPEGSCAAGATPAVARRISRSFVFPAKIEAQRSGFDFERRSSGANELSARLPEANDTELAPTPERVSFDAGLYDHGMYPFVFDPLFPVEGSPCGYGFVDLCMNTQMQIDLLDTAFLKNALVGATPRFFERVDGAVNEEEFKNISKSIVHVSGSLDETGIRPIDCPPLGGSYIAFWQNKVQELRETSGNTETSTGNTSAGVTAASAIAALQEASGKGSRDSTRASYRCFAEVVGLCVELIRQFYELPRTFRITGGDGRQSFTLFDNAALLPQPLGLGNEDLGFRTPLFDIRVEIQKRSAYTRRTQNDLALQLYRLGFFDPRAAAPALSCLEMMDFEGREEMRQQLARNGTLQERLERAARTALALTRRYEPENEAALAASLRLPDAPARGRDGGGGPPVPRTERARGQAQGAPVPPEAGA